MHQSGDGAATSKVSVSVLVPVFGADRALERCADALRAQTLPATQFEVIVIDNGPAEGALARRHALEAMVSGLPVRVLHQPRPGSYAARNMGIANSTAEVLAFTDADCIPDPSWLQRGIELLEKNQSVAALAGSIELFALTSTRRSGTELYELLHGFPQERYVRKLHFGATANLFVRRSTFDRVGPFDERLASGGDVEWGRRIYSLGLTMEYASSVSVRHPARADWPALKTKIFRVTKGIATLREHGESIPKVHPLTTALRPLIPPVFTLRRAWADPRIRTRLEFCRYAITLLRARAAIARARLITWRGKATN